MPVPSNEAGEANCSERAVEISTRPVRGTWRAARGLIIDAIHAKSTHAFSRVRHPGLRNSRAVRGQLPPGTDRGNLARDYYTRDDCHASAPHDNHHAIEPRSDSIRSIEAGTHD